MMSGGSIVVVKHAPLLEAFFAERESVVKGVPLRGRISAWIRSRLRRPAMARNSISDGVTLMMRAADSLRETAESFEFVADMLRSATPIGRRAVGGL